MADQTRRRGFRNSAVVSGAVQTQQNREKWLGAALYCVLGFTTAAARMSRTVFPDAVTNEEVIARCSEMV